jgi:hypothetical protein
METRIRPWLFRVFLSTGEDAIFLFGPVGDDEVVRSARVTSKATTAVAGANTRLFVDIRLFSAPIQLTDAQFATGDPVWGGYDIGDGFCVGVSATVNWTDVLVPLNWSPGGGLPHRWIGFRFDGGGLGASGADVALLLDVRKRGV